METDRPSFGCEVSKTTEATVVCSPELMSYMKMAYLGAASCQVHDTSGSPIQEDPFDTEQDKAINRGVVGPLCFSQKDSRHW